MSLAIGERVCVTEEVGGERRQLWATVRHIDLPDYEDFADIEVLLDDGRFGSISMPRTAVEDPWVPAPIKDLEALEQWLAR